MCRLLGFVAAAPTSVVDVLGREGLEAFTALTAVHGDGWGMSWLDGADDAARPRLRTASAPDSALLDPTYAELTRGVLGSAGLVHLRWATPGLRISPENTHPFLDGDHAFAHNGHVAPLDRLEGMLTRESRGRLRGDTDSERYFRFLMQCIEDEGDDRAGTTRALEILTAEFPDSSLNALMLTPERLFAVHVNSRAIAPVPAMRELFESPDELPYRHDDEYFAMDYRFTDDAVHVISSGLDEDGWTPMPEDTAMSVDLRTREVEYIFGR